MFDIITDSACDLTPEMTQKMGVEVVPFYVSLDGEHYRKEGKEIAVRDFYQFMVDNPSAYPKTSLASIEDFEEVFRRQAEAGRPTLCLCFTGKMSGCVGSARNARELVLEDLRQQSDGSWLVSGSASVDDLYETLGLPEDEDIDSNTVNGLVQEKTHHLPKVGDHFQLNDYEGVVTRTARRRVTEVRFTHTAPAPQDDEKDKDKRFSRLAQRTEGR